MGIVVAASGVVRVLDTRLRNKTARRAAVVVVARRRVGSMAGKYGVLKEAGRWKEGRKSGKSEAGRPLRL